MEPYQPSQQTPGQVPIYLPQTSRAPIYVYPQPAVQVSAYWYPEAVPQSLIYLNPYRVPQIPIPFHPQAAPEVSSQSSAQAPLPSQSELLHELSEVLRKMTAFAKEQYQALFRNLEEGQLQELFGQLTPQHREQLYTNLGRAGISYLCLLSHPNEFVRSLDDEQRKECIMGLKPEERDKALLEAIEFLKISVAGKTSPNSAGDQSRKDDTVSNSEEH